MGTRGGLLRPRKFEQSSGQVTLNRIEVTISHFPARLGQIPIELALNIGNEIVRLADTHAPEAGARFRARCRIPSKSALVSGVADGRLVRPTLRGALLGLEIGTSQSTLPVGAG